MSFLLLGTSDPWAMDSFGVYPLRRPVVVEAPHVRMQREVEGAHQAALSEARRIEREEIKALQAQCLAKFGYIP